MQFRKDSLNSFQVIERSRFRDGQSSKGIPQKLQRQEFWFLRSARRLMLVNIHMKFREDSLNCFQVKEQTRFCD